MDRAPGLNVRLKRLRKPFAHAELLARIRALAVLEHLLAARGRVVSAEELLKRSRP